jgi:hypothetical protein
MLIESIQEPSFINFKNALSTMKNINELIWSDNFRYMSTPLHLVVYYVCKCNDQAKKNILLQMVQYLIENNADINILDSKQKTSLSYAVYFNNYCLAKYLLYSSKYVDYNVLDSNKMTYLYYAIANDNYSITSLLLDLGKDTIQNKYINIAIKNNNIDIFRLLLKNNTIINNTSLFYALDNLLIPYGPIVNYTSIDILHIIFSYKPNLEMKNSYGDNPIHHYAKIITKIPYEFVSNNIKFFNLILYELIKHNPYDLLSLKNTEGKSFVTILSYNSGPILNMFIANINSVFKENTEFIDYLTVVNTMCNM